MAWFYLGTEYEIILVVVIIVIQGHDYCMKVFNLEASE